MNCPTCDADLQPGQRVCTLCGTPIPQASAGTPPPPPTLATPGTPPPPSFAPPPPPTNPVPQTAAAPTFQVVEQTPVAPPMTWPVDDDTTARFAPVTTAAPVYAPGQAPPTAVYTTTAWPAEPVPPPPPVVQQSRRNGVVLAVFAGLAGIATIVGSLLPVLELQTDANVTLTLGEFHLNDIHGGSNLQVAILIAGIVFLFGAILANFGQRLGAGLIGGTALTLCAYVAYIYGLVDFTSDQTVAAAAASAADGRGGTFVDSTISVGIFVLIAACALGIIAMFIGFAMSGIDTAPTLSRVICAAGAIASLAAAGGQLIPENGRTFADNFDADLSTAMITYSRLAIIAVVAICGFAGFLRSNRWGIGLALGGACIYLWQWVSSLLGIGELPVPPAFGNPGATTNDLKPTVVTTVGLTAMLVLAVLALVMRNVNQERPPA